MELREEVLSRCRDEGPPYLPEEPGRPGRERNIPVKERWKNLLMVSYYIFLPLIVRRYSHEKRSKENSMELAIPV